MFPQTHSFHPLSLCNLFESNFVLDHFAGEDSVLNQFTQEYSVFTREDSVLNQFAREDSSIAMQQLTDTFHSMFVCNINL